MSSPPAIPARDRYQILALTGGGYRGLYTIALLELCEQRFKASCRSKFDCFAGTSAGAILAAGLALGHSAEALKKAMIEHGGNIFPRKRGGSLGRRFLVGAPYQTKNLIDAVTAVLGENDACVTLDQIDVPLLITAVNYTNGTTAKFMSKGLGGQECSKLKVVDAITASAAAPTFFPLRKIDEMQYADGGLVANAPDMIALIETIGRKTALLQTVHMLSVGTASRREGAAIHKKPLNPSALSWFFYRGLTQSTMAAQEDLALSQVKALLNSRHLRLDQEPQQNQVRAISSLDKTDQIATDTLTMLAQTTFDEKAGSRQLRDFFR